ncbi:MULTISPECIES: PhoH family protein [Ralstonia solanacearum species complex]|uniref:Ribonuclease n=2 Tax=Ralstonia solanacearum species complex TaxID=3116862 RepID=A0AAD0S6S2_RALSL|nr:MULTISPECIES: PhoH family protein [Ralstonia solanacearum species complex]BEU72360.1 PhoH family protein [Ralstonia pseudosolanacearum]AMP37844.1 phosphate starvation-inducible protein PhoH [Ralstonia solanacearum]AXV77230.1 ribonuclease [Ralstonia solanacearum]AXV81793.1 ribonuclease [Ralstonia solanacearum]AXV86669.1 ribonuclease [Ralstonia solanacearum]
MPLPTMPTQPAQLLDPAEFKPFGKAARPKAGQEPRKPVPALEREALSETGRAQPKRSPAQARLGEASPMAKEDTRQRPTVIAKAVDKVSATGKSTETAARRRARRDDGPTKLFVLDTNVLMHDPSSLFRFEEHDVYLPMMTLEELDNHKKGMSEVARNARAVSRTLDQLVAGTDGVMDDGLPLSKLGNRDAQGHLFFQTRLNDIKLPDGLPQGKADNQILGVVSALQQQRPDRHVVLVSKDINMRIKARALGLPAEDYFNDRVLEDTDLLYNGVLSLPADFWQKHGKNIESWQDPKTGTTFYRLSGPLVPSFLVNQFVFLEPNDGSLPLYAQVKELNGKTAVLQTLKDYTHQKNNVWGVTARNREQNFALNLLMHPEIDFVSLLGQAGTGKTLLALAAGLEQVLDQKLYNEIIITRATVPVGEDIGFLPGTEEEKMQPWMGAFDDNLEVLQKSDDNAGEWGRAATQELIRSRIKVKSMNFMRGRTFVNKFLIIDEAQNLTPKQMKTLVTRAGPGTKIVCLGNIAQIDTPYLTEGSSGLTYVVDRFKGWSHSGHITLARGERSRLADHASDVL